MERKTQLINIPQSKRDNVSKNATKKLNKYFGIRGRNPIKQIKEKLKINSNRKRDDAIKRDLYRQMAERYNNEVEQKNKQIVARRKLRNVKGLIDYKMNSITVAFKKEKKDGGFYAVYEDDIPLRIDPFESNRLVFEGEAGKKFDERLENILAQSPIVGYYLPNGEYVDLRKENARYKKSKDFDFVNYINFNKIPKSKKQSKIKDAGAINLDGFIKNDEWDTKTNKCVPDWIIYKYKNVKGFIKKCSYEAIEELSNYGIVSVDDYNPNKNGYTINHIRNWCYNVGVNCYIMNDGRLTIYDCREKVYKNIPLVIEVKNNHLYPITDKNIIAKIKGMATNTLRTELSNFQETEKKVKQYEKILNTEKQSNNEWFCEMMEKEDLMTYQNRNITFMNGTIQNFKLDNKLYIADYNEDLHSYFGDEYVGQNEISILSEYVNDISRGMMNGEVRDALFRKNVKNRVHIGKVKPEIDIYDENVMKYDINKHYRYVMENPLDDFIETDFNSMIVDKNEYDGEFGLYFIETDDLTLLHKSNWYSNKIIEEAIKNNINFKVKYFITNCKRVDRNILKNIIERISEEIDDPVVKKLVINALSGYMGKTHTKNTYVNIDNDINKVWDTYFKLRNVEYMDLFYKEIETESNKKYYLYGETIKREITENRLPIYIQILDWSNIVLYNHIKNIGGELVARKVDAFYILNPENEPELTDEIGGLKIEDKTYVCEMDKDRGMNYTFVRNKWNKLDIDDSNEWEQILEQSKENSFMLLGRAGTGKTFVLKKIKEYYGNRCVCLAYTNKATNNLGGSTIHKWLKMKDGKLNRSWFYKMLTQNEVIIIDEISMIGKDLWKIFENIKEQSNIRFILAGDYRQLPPIGDDCDYFNHSSIVKMCDNTKIELTNIKRYDNELYEASEKVWNNEDVEFNTEPFNYNKIVNAECNICWTNKKRKSINKMCNQYWSKKADKSLYVEYKGEENKYNEDIILYQGVKLLVNVNNTKYELRKNETLILNDFDSENLYFENELTIPIEKLHSYFILGYCITAYKSQGDTYDGNVNLFDLWFLQKDKRYLYTSITRTTKFNNLTFFC